MKPASTDSLVDARERVAELLERATRLGGVLKHLHDSACRMDGSEGSRQHLRCALEVVASEGDGLTEDVERIGWALEDDAADTLRHRLARADAQQQAAALEAQALRRQEDRFEGEAAEAVAALEDVCDEAYPELYDDDPVAHQLSTLTAEWDEISGFGRFDRLATLDDAGLVEIEWRLRLAAATEAAREARY